MRFGLYGVGRGAVTGFIERWVHDDKVETIIDEASGSACLSSQRDICFENIDAIKQGCIQWMADAFMREVQHEARTFNKCDVRMLATGGPSESGSTCATTEISELT